MFNPQLERESTKPTIMEELNSLILQLSGYVGALRKGQLGLDANDPHYKEITAALREVRDNIEWCLTLKPELEENGVLKRNPKLE